MKNDDGCGCGGVYDSTQSAVDIDPDTNNNCIATIDAQNHIVLSAELRNTLGIKAGAKLRIVNEGGKIEIYPNIHSLAKLYIEPTSDCNLNCQTCIRNTWNEPLGSMDIQVFDAIADQLKDFDTLKTVMFGGLGEPTYHKDILYMIGRVKSLGLNVEMTTNGSLLSDELLKGLVDNRLDTLWVSFDGTSKEFFDEIRAGANFDSIVRRLKRLNEFNKNSAHQVEIGIAFVVMKKNIGELKNLDVLAANIGASKISVSNVIPYSKDMIEQMVCDLSINSFYSEQPAINLPLIDHVGKNSQPLFELFSKNNNISIMKNKITVPTNHCRFIKERCSFIRWDGLVSTCMGLLHSYKTYFITSGIERNVTAYSLGTVKEKKLKEIWDSQEYHDFREKVDEFDFSPCLQCGPCDFAEANQEDCLGNKFPTCGGCLWAQGVIQCP